MIFIRGLIFGRFEILFGIWVMGLKRLRKRGRKFYFLGLGCIFGLVCQRRCFLFLGRRVQSVFCWRVQRVGVWLQVWYFSYRFVFVLFFRVFLCAFFCLREYIFVFDLVVCFLVLWREFLVCVSLFFCGVDGVRDLVSNQVKTFFLEVFGFEGCCLGCCFVMVFRRIEGMFVIQVLVMTVVEIFVFFYTTFGQVKIGVGYGFVLYIFGF